MDGQRSLETESLALATDLYQLTMAYGYWKHGLHEREAVFHLFFRRSPFQGGYTVACGLGTALNFLERFRFHGHDLDYLGTLTGRDGLPLFSHEFLAALGTLRLTCDLDAVPEGTLVFPHEPLLRFTGPLWQGQLLETPLLNILNFQSLIATKAARIRSIVGDDDEVLEFGLRRAQGLDGGLSASRAAFIGGAQATSNVLAGKLFDIPVRGTHAHSWVMTFPHELDSFQAYADAMPNNCVLLVDTYDTLEGVRRAAQVGRALHAAGHRMLGIRLDSGDLVALSIAARKILDEAGLPYAKIVASNDLDEYQIADFKARGARIDIWGVGTRLVTAYDQPALGGVYKLAAIRNAHGQWEEKLKLSEDPIKVSNPGRQQVRRFFDGPRAIADVIYNPDHALSSPVRYLPLEAHAAERALPDALPHEDLLVPMLRQGEQVYDTPSLRASQARTRAQVQIFAPRVTQLVNPDTYSVGLSSELAAHKLHLMELARNRAV